MARSLSRSRSPSRRRRHSPSPVSHRHSRRDRTSSRRRSRSPSHKRRRSRTRSPSSPRRRSRRHRSRSRTTSSLSPPPKSPTPTHVSNNLKLKKDEEEKKRVFEEKMSSNEVVGGIGSNNGSSSQSESGSVGVAGIGSRSGAKIPSKNAPGNRSDVAWNHGISINGDARKIKCKYCKKVLTGGVYRLKHHLAGTKKDVGICASVPDDVKKEMWDIVVGLQQNLVMKSRSDEERGLIDNNNDDFSVGVGEKRKGKEVETPANIFKKRGVGTQATINNIFKKSLREEACQEIASFIYNNGIPLNVSTSEEYTRMFEKVARHGLGFKPPSYYELRVKYLKQKVDETLSSIKEHRAYWKKNGCTIMIDGWTDKRRRTILNFLVNSPKGTIFLKSIDASHISKTADKIFKMIDDVVEEVGEENVVQVVTDNAANYKSAGNMLMDKRKRLYWTPCAAHCIDLMLEDFEKKLPLHKDTIFKGRKITTYIYARTSLISMLQQNTQGKDLVRPGTTRVATSYLTLGCLNEKMRALQRMFTSKEWESNKCSKTRDGKLVENIVLNMQFWKDIVLCLRGAYPLLHVLRLVDLDEKPTMGYIYMKIDQAKEKIKNAFDGVEMSYMPLWEIIDARWDKQLLRPLHAAGYYLNPQIHYSPGFKIEWALKRGLYDCMERIVANQEEITKIDAQLEDFKSQSKFFGSQVAKAALNTKTPAQWWDSYGDEHPELQRFAIRVLSLTCSSSRCERNWSAFEMVHTKRRNRLKQKTINDVVFVMANSKLSQKKQAKKSVIEYSIDELDSDEEWIVDDDDDVMEGLDDVDVSNDVNLVQGEGSSAAVPDDLEIPILVDDDEFEQLL